jgi:hypothetical protein
MFDPETQEQLTLQSMPQVNLTCCMNRKTLRGELMIIPSSNCCQFFESPLNLSGWDMW